MSSEFTVLVDRATTPGPMEDWDTILQICDILTHRPDEASLVVMDAIDNKLRNNNPQVQLLALTLLDACIKNSTQYFIRIVSQNNKLRTVSALQQSNVAELRERSTELLKEWQPTLQKAQVLTPTSPLDAPYQAPRPSAVAPSRPKRSPQEKRQKLEQDLLVVHDTIKLLIDFVNAAQSPQDLKQQDVQQVVINCDEMHRRLVALIERVPEEQLLLTLIGANEELCAAIDYYDAYKKTGAKNVSLIKSSSSTLDNTSIIPQQQKPIDLDDIFMPPPVSMLSSSRPSAPASEDPLSLDDLLSMPSRPTGYGDAMARELQSVEGESSNSAFAALARRHTPSAPVLNSEINQQFVNAVPKQTSPNPFDFDVVPQQQQQPLYPNTSPFQEQPLYNQPMMYAPSNQQQLPPVDQDQQQGGSGFSAIARRKDPSQDFSQYLDTASKSNVNKHDSPF